VVCIQEDVESPIDGGQTNNQVWGNASNYKEGTLVIEEKLDNIMVGWDHQENALLKIKG
jgi:hypothetical protein